MRYSHSKRAPHKTRTIAGFKQLFFISTAAMLITCGCSIDVPHSILHPAGPNAGSIAWLSWLMIIVYGIVFIVTLSILALALSARKREKPLLGSKFVVTAGIVIPTIILVIMLIVELRISGKVSMHHTESGFKVQVIGHGWWFEVRYPALDITDANEIHIPVHTPVDFELSSAHMVHAFWVPRLGGKRDQLPDHPNSLVLEASDPGVYPGVCAEYCAGQHARMEFRLVAHTADDFQHWVDRSRATSPVPSEPALIRGRDAFLNGGCAACHAVKGTSAAAAGPDLTLIGSRLTIGAGQFDNSHGALSGWIANPQALKPRNMMPRTYLPPGELHSLVQYLSVLQGFAWKTAPLTGTDTVAWSQKNCTTIPLSITRTKGIRSLQ